jgi:hypothetical protein
MDCYTAITFDTYLLALLYFSVLKVIVLHLVFFINTTESTIEIVIVT